MRIKLVKLRHHGIEVDRRIIREATGHRGLLVILDVTDQGLRRPAKVARLMQDDSIRAELCDVRIVWANEGRMTLTGFERQRNKAGQTVEYAQSWLCMLDLAPYGAAPASNAHC